MFKRPLLICLLISLSFFVWSLGFTENRINGNKLYNEGDFDGSSLEYTKGLTKKANFDLYYNRGASFYKLGLYNKALSDFEDAGTYSDSTTQQVRALYNAGNSSFMGAETAKTENPNQALDSYIKAVKHFERALELDNNANAAYNLELARLRWNELKKQMEEQQQDQQDQSSEDQESENQDQNSEQRNESQDQNQQENSDQSQEQQQNQEQSPEESRSSEAAASNENVSPEDILNEEARRKEAVQLLISNGTADVVDKDW
jgi:Ca-activated chloride channel homolog